MDQSLKANLVRLRRSLCDEMFHTFRNITGTDEKLEIFQAVVGNRHEAVPVVVSMEVFSEKASADCETITDRHIDDKEPTEVMASIDCQTITDGQISDDVASTEEIQNCDCRGGNRVIPKSLHKRSKSDGTEYAESKFLDWNRSKTYPFAKVYLTRNPSLSTNDLETDSIVASDVHQEHLRNQPISVPVEYTTTDGPPTKERSFLSRRKQPVQTSEIYIPHKYADQPIGDLFGAKLTTYLIERKDRWFYQHFFQDVKKDEPAGRMKVREDDELVLINGIFVPNLNHADVLNQFHSVKVDGKSRLTLVIRRVNKYDKKNKWEWIETSAVLAPDAHQMPKVTSLKIHELIDGELKPSLVKLKVPGSQLYLGIKQEVVFADVWTGTSEDHTKIIVRRAKVKANTESPDGLPCRYEAALCNEKWTSYIGIDEQDKVTLMREPLWFGMTEKEATVKFSFRNKFLGFNMKTEMLETKEYEYHFEKEDYDGHDLDEPDGKTEMVVDTMCFESPRSVCLCTGRE